MNRKGGGIVDLGIIMALFMFFIIAWFLSAYLQNQINAGITATAPMNSNATYIMNQSAVVQNIFLNSIPFLYIGLGIAAIISAFFIPSHPVLVPISILMLSIYTVLATIFSNVIWEFLNVPGIQAIANNFPLIISLTVKQPYVITLIGAIIIIVMCSKSGE